MGNKFVPGITTKGQLNSISIVNGQLLATSDTLELFIDNDGVRNKYSDIVFGTYSSITTNATPLTDKIYFATDTHQLLQATYSGATVTWTELGGGSGGGMRWSSVPATANSFGTAGQVAYDANYFYVCVASNTWKRALLSTWGDSDDSYSVSGTMLYTASTDSVSGTKLTITNGRGSVSGTKVILS